MAQENAPKLPVYVALGTDTAKMAEIVRRLKLYIQPQMSFFNCNEWHAVDIKDSQTLLSVFLQMPVCDTRRLAIIYEAEALPKDVIADIIDYLKHPNPSCIVCLCMQRLAKNSKLYKAISAVDPKAIINCEPQTASQAHRTLSVLEKKLNVSVDFDAADELINRVGTSLSVLEKQLEILKHSVSLSSTDQTHAVQPLRITKDLVCSHVIRTNTQQPWELIDALAARECARALTLLEAQAQTSPLYLLALISKRLRELICAKSLTARGQLVRMPEKVNVKSWQVNKLRAAADNFEAAELDKLLCESADLNMRFKLSRATFTDLVLFAQKICSPRQGEM